LIWVVYMHHAGRICEGSCGGSTPEVASPEVVNRNRKWKGDISPRFFPVFLALFSHWVFAVFFSWTSLDSMCEQRNCESNMYWITIVLLPAIAMLSHFLNPWLITALTGTPVSIDKEVFQTEEIYIIVCCLIKDLSLLFYYFKYYTIHMGFSTLF
jgi:hypothetical protein